MITNKPSKSEPALAGALLYLAPGRSMKPIVATLCCLRKIENDEMESIKREHKGLGQAIQKMRNAEMPTDQEAELIFGAFRTQFVTKEQISTVQKDLEKILGTIIVGKKLLTEIDHIQELRPLIVSRL